MCIYTHLYVHIDMYILNSFLRCWRQLSLPQLHDHVLQMTPALQNGGLQQATQCLDIYLIDLVINVYDYMYASIYTCIYSTYIYMQLPTVLVHWVPDEAG